MTNLVVKHPGHEDQSVHGRKGGSEGKATDGNKPTGKPVKLPEAAQEAFHEIVGDLNDEGKLDDATTETLRAAIESGKPLTPDLPGMREVEARITGLQEQGGMPGLNKLESHIYKYKKSAAADSVVAVVSEIVKSLVIKHPGHEDQSVHGRKG